MSPTQALLWKEWTEHRWKLAFGTVMLASFGGARFAWGAISDRELIILVMGVGCLVLSVLNAMGTFAEEHSEGTTLFLAARPIAVGRVFLGKWMVGWINTVVPLLGCGLTLGVWFGSSPDSGRVVRDLVPGTVAMTWIATLLYSLTCCVTLRRGGPAGVALTGLFWVGAICLHATLSETLRPHASHASPLQVLGFFINPMMALAMISPPSWLKNASLPAATGMVEQVALLAVVLWVGLWNWKRSA
jgi:hypothetical protein